MRTEKKTTALLSAVVIAGLAFMGFYSQINVRNSTARIAGQLSRQQKEVARLESEISNLRQAQQELSNAAFVTNEALTKERRNARDAQRKVSSLIAKNKSLLDRINRELSGKEGVSQVKDKLNKDLEDMAIQNAGLQKEVELLRRNFDVALQVRMRLAEVEESLGGLIVQKGKEDILRMQMEALTREVEDVNRYLLEVRDNRISRGPDALPVPADRGKASEQKGSADTAVEIKYLGQVNELKARINILMNENAVLKEKYGMAQDMSDQHKKGLDAGSEKVFALQSRLIETESALSQSKMRYNDLERSVASLRERYVANELEKEGLKIKLNRLTAELQEVRSKFLALLGKISDIFQSPGGARIPQDERDNLTSIIGVELFPNTPDTRP